MIEIISSVKELRKVIKNYRKEGFCVGLVPTMGYLHNGHQSLIKAAVDGNDKVIVSIFVNPMQFGPSEDLAKYPRDFERDKKVCIESGAHIIFKPDVDEMYERDFCTYVDMSELTGQLCGISRPGHFRGVCTVVNKLFNIVMPDKAYFGQKDAQQLAVIRRMVKDLNMDIEVVGCPILREHDGLAMSSRNVYLSPEERNAALCLYKSAVYGKKMIINGERDVSIIEDEMKTLIEKEPLAKIDYVKIVDADSIQPLKIIDADKTILCALAVYIGKTRLIDNFIYEGI